MLIFCKCKRRGSVSETRAKAGEAEPDAKNTLKHLPMDHCINIITCQWARNSTRPTAKLLFDSNSSRLNADLRKCKTLKQNQHFQNAGSPRIPLGIDPLQMQAKGCREWGESKGGRSGAKHEERIASPANGPRINMI